MEAKRLKKLYTLKEASDTFDIHYRKIQRRAKKLNIKKLGREYMVDDEFMQREFNVFLDNSVNSIKMSTVKSLGVNRDVNRTINIDDEKTQLDNNQIESLQNEISELRKALSQHNRLFNLIEKKGLLDDNIVPPAPLKTYKNVEVESNVEVENDVEDFKTSAEWYKSVHPEGKEIKNDKGEVIDIQPSMNDVNFQSSYNYYKKPNKE